MILIYSPCITLERWRKVKKAIVRCLTSLGGHNVALHQHGSKATVGFQEKTNSIQIGQVYTTFRRGDIWMDCFALHDSICIQQGCTASIVSLRTSSSYLTLYAPYIIYNVYINQQDAQNSCDQTLFSIRCSTCFGLYQSIFRSNFISCTSRLVYACICHTTTRRMVPTYTGIYQMRCIAYKVSPEDGLIQSETCRASNRK